MNIGINVKVGAKFKLIAHKGDGVAIRETSWFNNLVLDSGLAQMSVGDWVNQCCVGTGNTAVLASQTALAGFLASTSVKQSRSSIKNTSAAPYYFGFQITWRFGQGVATGNVSEVGVGWGSSNLWNRALIKDIEGNPTTITILSDEHLDVVSEIRFYLPTTLSGSFNLLDKLGGIVSTHNYSGKPILFDALDLNYIGKLSLSDDGNCTPTIYTGTQGAITTKPSGTAVGLTQGITTYPTPTSTRYVATLGLGVGNQEHKTFTIPVHNFANRLGAVGVQLTITPTITKNNTQIMTYTFEMSWGRYEPT